MDQINRIALIELPTPSPPKRTLSGIVDFLTFSLLALSIFTIWYGGIPHLSLGLLAYFRFQTILKGSLVLSMVICWTIMPYLLGGTPGMLLFGMRIFQRFNFKPPSLSRLLVKTFTVPLDMLTLGIAPFALKTRQMLSDYLSGLVVFDRKILSQKIIEECGEARPIKSILNELDAVEKAFLSGALDSKEFSSKVNQLLTELYVSYQAKLATGKGSPVEKLREISREKIPDSVKENLYLDMLTETLYARALESFKASKRNFTKEFLNTLLYHAPINIRAFKSYTLVAAFIFTITFLIGVLFANLFPIPSMPGASLERDVNMFLMIFFNNLSIVAMELMLSPLAAVPTILILALNGGIIGAVVTYSLQCNPPEFILSLLLPHAIPELFSFILGGAMGLKLFVEIMKPSLKDRALSIFILSEKIGSLLLMIIILLVIAAFIETFISGNYTLSHIAKYAV
ncbi:MAG TPA: hypothetical protein ENG22_00145, partial [Candidatus Bathyarchaeota archaeon]|nr:hypothetical protein [Candidatus Bathyarchaeota archaeon]